MNRDFDPHSETGLSGILPVLPGLEALSRAVVHDTLTMRKVQDKIVAAAKAMPDREVTADKMAVAAAMRCASTSRTPEEPKPNYGKMTDAEFQKAKEDLGL